MEEHYEELKDDELNSDGGEFFEVANTRSTKSKKKVTKAKNQTSQNADPLSTRESSLPDRVGVGDSKEWIPQSLLTDWGRTDDVVTIGNGEQYYFFKIPHKVKVCKGKSVI